MVVKLFTRAREPCNDLFGELTTMKLIRLLAFIPLFAVSVAAQTHFYLEEPFKGPSEIPDDLVPVLHQEVIRACGSEAVNGDTNISSWFSASKIDVSKHSSALILKSDKICLNGADNDWFWIFIKTPRGYRLVLHDGGILVDVLGSEAHGLRDLEGNIATAQSNYTTIYKFNGSVYSAHICKESTPVEAKPKTVPCRRR